MNFYLEVIHSLLSCAGGRLKSLIILSWWQKVLITRYAILLPYILNETQSRINTAKRQRTANDKNGSSTMAQ
jgi:hypothetical protein